MLFSVSLCNSPCLRDEAELLPKKVILERAAHLCYKNIEQPKSAPLREIIYGNSNKNLQ
jgi:hypothetical protein